MKFIKWLTSKFTKPPVFKRGSTITKAEQIKAIIAPIPKEKFIVNLYGDWEGNSCFLGHIHRTLSPSGKSDYSGDYKGYGARELTQKFIKDVHGLRFDGADVNNTPLVNGYTENNPKDRILHLVDDMIKAGY